MKEIFKQLNNAYHNNNFGIILNHQFGNYFLKLRSLSRTEILKGLAQRANINVLNIQSRSLFEYLFCKNISEQTINDYIREIYQQERYARIKNEDNLYSQLYRLNVFN